MTRIDSYNQALDWLYRRNQFAIKLGLEGPRHLLEALGSPDRSGIYLHVAGTNGKGSVCANLAALLSHNGYRRVGLYTSPHLVSFRERIRVNGAPVSPHWVTGWMQRSIGVLEELNPTYFECVTAMAFAWFQEQGCDAVVLETGLGGRLDATNVVAPKISVITSISFDHTAILGNTLEAIQGEKLGIVKPEVPLILDEARPELVQQAVEKARALNVPLFNLADRLTEDASPLILRGRYGEYTLPPDLREETHQLRNAALSLLAFEIFLGRALESQEWLPVLRKTKFPGRTQWLQGDGVIPALLDGAHNPDGVKALCAYLRKGNFGRPRFFFSSMGDKDFLSLYTQLRELSDDLVFLDLSQIFPRALTVENLRAALPPEEGKGLRVAVPSWNSLEPLLRESGADYAVFCGSLYLLGEIIPTLLPHYRGLEEFKALLEEEK